MNKIQVNMLLSMIQGLKSQNSDDLGNIHIDGKYYSKKEIQELIKTLEQEST